MRRLIPTLIALLAVGCLAGPGVVFAAEDQFYFVGKTVTSRGPIPGATHVYLRWDSVEGRLPADVQAFRLLKNGEAVGADWPVNGVMSPAGIAALYAGPDHQRRKLETITRLNEVTSDRGIPFSPSEFAQVLRDLIDPADARGNYDPLWAFLGSRTDFNVARARYRGWIDTAPTPADGASVVTYELLGVSGDATARLGYIEVDPTGQQQALGASDLRQIRLSDWRCDLPETSQDHYTVMLDWTSPGAGNVSDRVAAQSYISGFDLYRTTENLAPTEQDAPARDIAALAASAPVDSRGRPQIDGLEKVNVALIIDSGAPSTDPEWQEARQYHIERLGGVDALPAVPDVNIPIDPKWVEARDQLMRAGLRPGDRRAYYLVPRDFTGRYGPTVGEVVEVPLMTRPPAPWNLRVFADETSSALNRGNDALTITWDEVTIDNYIDFYAGTRLFCNTVEARTTGVLEYVPVGADCATSPRNAVRLDVADYRIYRFENFDIAGRFKDSDGDGFEDSVETPDLDSNGRIDAFERSAGTQCNALLPGNDADPELKNYLQYAYGNGSVTLGRPSLFNPNAPSIARMRDEVPAGTRDTVYWYRVVSEAPAFGTVGRLSHMSAPQRGLFPDREPPPVPDVSVNAPGLRGGTPAVPGQLVPGGVLVDVRPPPPDEGGSYCISVFQNIDGTSTRLGSTCDAGGIQLPPQTGYFCGYAIATDENNNISATVQFPCTITPEHPKTPSPPQVLALEVDDSLARFTFRLPAEQVAMTIARLNHEPGVGAGTSAIESIPVIDNETGDTLDVSMPVDALQLRQDRFCLSLMSVGRDDGTGAAPKSDWSSEKCFTRTASGEDLPEYLQWPAVQGAIEGPQLTPALVTDFLDFRPFLAFELGESATLLQDDAQVTDCQAQVPDPLPVIIDDFYPFACSDEGYARFLGFVEPELNFILYRQERVLGEAASSWVQVSPMIDYVHFDRSEIDIGLDTGPITIWTLNDPFIKAVANQDPKSPPDVVQIWFVDQYPFRLSRDRAGAEPIEWRYQAVYFDAEHRPATYRVSDWFREGSL